MISITGIQRTVTITVLRGKDSYQFECKDNESLLSAMLRNKLYLSAYCGGKGTCGKCKVQLIKGALKVSVPDQKKLSKEELEMGYRLSCFAFPKEDCTVRLEYGDESDFLIIGEHSSETSEIAEDMKEDVKEDCAIAIDIGTTTIAISLVGLTSKRSINTYTTVNKQRAYGADVIARIQASNEGKKKLLQEVIRQELLEGIKVVINRTGIKKSQLKTIVVAGNTTMGHLLMGYSCETLGIFPFTPVNIKVTWMNFQDMFENDYLDIPVTLLPGISAFVGADIVAGLSVCNFDQSETVCLLIDLGTNGEMAIGNKNKILVSSTAAGPAFEGGNISCGVGSISGAISGVLLEGDTISYQTIQDKSPVGICGTGVIEMTSELLKTGLIDETGLLKEKYFEEGYEITSVGEDRIVFTQKDIREIQLAKAAVRAGIEILIRRYGVTLEQIDTVYLAGGFGYKINIEKAIHIGLLPKELAGRIKAIGNSSLAGAIKYVLEEATVVKMDKIIEVADEITLANDNDFYECYVNYMYF
jgi:uncharacterized 2Fe-2S/4Fe-4S cluster protein (DUF4445 family)